MKQTMSNMSLQQLNEMNDKAKRLVELMKQGIVEFIFKKKSTNKTRKAKGTLKRDLIPKEAQRKKGRPRKRPDDLVIYYDVEKQAIRSFKDYLLQKVLKNNVDNGKNDKQDTRSLTLASKQNLKNKNLSNASEKQKDMQDKKK